MCGKKGLLKLSNHLTNVHKLSTQERQPYLIRAKKMPIDKATVLIEFQKITHYGQKFATLSQYFVSG